MPQTNKRLRIVSPPTASPPPATGDAGPATHQPVGQPMMPIPPNMAFYNGQSMPWFPPHPQAPVQHAPVQHAPFHHGQGHHGQGHHGQGHHGHKGKDTQPRRHQQTIMVPVPDEFVGFVLGAKGKSIRKVKDDTRADYIRLHDAEPEESRPDPYFVVKGSHIAVGRAKGTILEMAMEAYRRSKSSGMTTNERRLKDQIDSLTNDIARLQTSASTQPTMNSFGDDGGGASFTPQSPDYSPHSPEPNGC